MEEDPNSASDESDLEERETIRSELKQMSIEELQKLKERIGLKLFNKAMEKDTKKGDKPSSRKREVFKRENKNRPRELSAKKQVARFRDVVGLSSEMNTKTTLGKRDPRFDSLCGEFDEKYFAGNYKFVDDIKAKERKRLEEELEAEKDPERIKQIKYLIQRHDNQIRERTKLAAKKAIKDEEKGRNKQLIKEGKKPVFASKAEQRNKELVSKYEELKKKGSLEKYIKKKNKEKASKGRKLMKE